MILNRTKIETELARNCLTISDFVETSGVSRSAFDQAIRGKNIRPVTAGKIAAALHTDVQSLLEEAPQ